jgi:hypothetical protein
MQMQAGRRPAQQRSAGDNQRKGHIEQVDRDECGNGNRHISPPAQRAASHADDRLHDNGQHGRLQPEEQALQHRGIADQDIGPAQPHDGHQTGQDEQNASHQRAADAMHQPPDVGRQLLRLWPRQQHAEVQCMQKPPITQPALLLNKDAVHDRNLPGWPAETQQRDATPDSRRFA